jgi:hypothetical protein
MSFPVERLAVAMVTTRTAPRQASGAVVIVPLLSLREPLAHGTHAVSVARGGRQAELFAQQAAGAR